MFLFGLFVGIAFAVLVYELLGRHTETRHDQWIFLERPFLSALVLGLLSLFAAIMIDAFLVDGYAPGFVASVFGEWKTYVSVFKEFFFAFVIAMFVIVTIERSSRAEQNNFLVRANEAAQKNVFDAVYKRRIDPSVFAEVEQSVFESDFVRLRHDRTIHISAIDGHDDSILLTSNQDFRLKNISGADREYKFRAYLPKPHASFEGRNKVTEITISRISNGARLDPDVAISGAAVDACLKEDPLSPDEIFYLSDTVIVASGEEINVEVSLELVKERFDNEIWTTLLPTLYAEVTVVSRVQGLRLSAISLNRQSLVEAKTGAGNGDHETKKWKIEKPMLPYQGYVVSWSREDRD